MARGHDRGTSRPAVEVTATTPAERLAASAAVAAFRRGLGRESSVFVADVGRLQADLQSGDAPTARSDELTAQADYDQFRLIAGGDPVNASTLDEVAADVGPHQSFAGLHAVEQALWAPAPGMDGTARALAATEGLMAQAPVAEFLLSKDSVAPEAIGVTGVDDLDWVTHVAVPGREELYSHLDAVDIAAGVAAARAAFIAIAPLATQVSPELSTEVGQRFSSLEADVAGLGTPTSTVDASLPPSGLLALSQQVDATAAGLAQLAATLVPFGTGGGSS